MLQLFPMSYKNYYLRETCNLDQEKEPVKCALQLVFVSNPQPESCVEISPVYRKLITIFEARPFLTSRING